jgi:hypothetical protein
MDAPKRFNDEVLSRLHEAADAAREVPANSQPPRLKDALASLVALDVFSTGTFVLPPDFYPDYAGPAPSS